MTIITAGDFPNKTQTMPLAIYLGFEIDLSVALTIAIIMFYISFSNLANGKGIMYRQLNIT